MNSSRRNHQRFGRIALSLALALFILLQAHLGHISSIRRLSEYLGDGKCKWTPPLYEIPNNITFTKTLIAGYPSGDKRLTFVQMEALTGLSAKDEWDFVFKVSASHF